MSNFFRKTVAPVAMLLASSVGVAACGGGNGNEVKDCPKNFTITSIEVPNAAPVIKAMASLAQQSVGGYYGSDPYDLSDKPYDQRSEGDMQKVDNPDEVVCVESKKVYLSSKVMQIAGKAEADGYKLDFEKGTATKAETE